MTSAGSRPSAPVMFTCPAPALLKQAIQSPSRAQLVDYIPTTSRRPLVIISSSHQYQSFHKSLHKPLNRLRNKARTLTDSRPRTVRTRGTWALQVVGSIKRARTICSKARSSPPLHPVPGGYTPRAERPTTGPSAWRPPPRRRWLALRRLAVPLVTKGDGFRASWSRACGTGRSPSRPPALPGCGLSLGAR